MEPQDTITIAPAVLITIAQHAATQVTGVSHMGTIPVNIGRLFRGNPMGNGVVLAIEGQRVTADVYIVVFPDVNIKDVSNEVQQRITRSIEELVGMDVDSVNVHVEDVNYGGTLPAAT
jgi:uncharacterized alkaline shock family protein YloU